MMLRNNNVGYGLVACMALALDMGSKGSTVNGFRLYLYEAYKVRRFARKPWLRWPYHIRRAVYRQYTVGGWPSSGEAFIDFDLIREDFARRATL